MRWHVSLLVVVSACVGFSPPDEGTIPDDTQGVASYTPSQAGASAAGSASTVGSVGGSGGVPAVSVSAPASGGVAGGVLDLPPVAPPVYSRDCIEERLGITPAASGGSGGGNQADRARAPQAGNGQGGGGAPSQPEAGAGGEVDLALGAGDLTLIVVFDKSGSMSGGWNESTKWQVANEALLKAIGKFADNLTVGTIFFPMPGNCSVEPLGSELQIGYMPGPRFLEYWESTQSSRAPDGSTPLELALHVADMAVEQGCRLGLLEDRVRVVLVTDGEPTCGDNPSVMTGLAAEWSELGVETWVMGLPGSAGATALLDAIALAGGTGKHQSLGEPTQLEEGLEEAAE